MAKGKREPRVRLERTDAAFAQDDVLISLVEHVFGSQQELVDGGGRAALQQHGNTRLTDGLQQVVILHVARADLQDVGIPGDEIHVMGRHHLGDDRQAGFFTGRCQQFQPEFLQALEGIGAGRAA